MGTTRSCRPGPPSGAAPPVTSDAVFRVAGQDADGRTFTVLDPSDGTAITTVALAGSADVDQAVAAAKSIVEALRR